MIYNEFRPQIFDQILGQEVSVTVARNLVVKYQNNDGKMPNLLMVGLHGSGKTTTARVVGKAVNCEAPQDGNPCNQCKSCIDYEKGNNYDIKEIDGASNNSVDDVRKIQEELVYGPQRKKKVYIIDEVHMLSKVAFNALLKTIEETPKYVMFILCTTEVDKVPKTIKSRCIRLDFNRIATKEIYENLDFICLEKDLKYEEEGLKLISKIVNGSMRDALSMFEKCISYGELTYKNISDVLGLVDIYTVQDIMLNIFNKKPLEAMETITDLYNKGKDMLQLAIDMLQVMRNVMILQTTDNNILFDIDITQLKGVKLNPIDCYTAINELSNLQKSMMNSDNQKILMDVAVLQLSQIINAEVTTDEPSKTKEEGSKKISSEVKKESSINIDEIDHNDYLINKIDLIKSYDDDDKIKALVNATIYTKKDAFIIMASEKNNLDIDDLKDKMKKITGKELNILIKTA
ncbi:DNA polymerase III subunit gamma/tau [Alkaliphilus sp. B6464]|uniref:DNA polymerase III subunit gamma/tau n=1 Tax=Alkaliphilus sp. B6464 TaxID=2731219 RepID=UPI001BAB6699|nr:DNA polymerase III subunit gamma/tau [Alkaliphilus sp. B6464]QUH22102.1 DNA polymerase III subunit gamma/tau [Alkaliphilus sp. B6464]